MFDLFLKNSSFQKKKFNAKTNGKDSEKSTNSFDTMKASKNNYVDELKKHF